MTTDQAGKPLGWNAASNARHEVKLRDYLDTLRSKIGIEIEARILNGCVDYYGLGHEIVDLPHIRSLIEFVTATPTPVQDDVERVARASITEEMVTAAMRGFEPFAARLLRYPEKDRWHLNDIQGMREAIRAALAAMPGRENELRDARSSGPETGSSQGQAKDRDGLPPPPDRVAIARASEEAETLRTYASILEKPKLRLSNPRVEPGDVYENAGQILKRAAQSLRLEAAALLAAGPAPGEDWQPIRTAPKDGQHVDIWYADSGRKTDAFFEGGVWKWWTHWRANKSGGGVHFYSNYGDDDLPTHWRPLPAPPRPAPPSPDQTEGE